MNSKSTPAIRDYIYMIDQQKKAKYPNVPDYAIPKEKPDTTSANGLTQSIIHYITLSGGWATRISTEGRYVEGLKRRIKSSVRKGTADIHAVYKGKHLSIEVKVGKDRQSKEQKSVQEGIEQAGGIYFVARTFDQFHQFFNSL